MELGESYFSYVVSTDVSLARRKFENAMSWFLAVILFVVYFAHKYHLYFIGIEEKYLIAIQLQKYLTRVRSVTVLNQVDFYLILKVPIFVKSERNKHRPTWVQTDGEKKKSSRCLSCVLGPNTVSFQFKIPERERPKDRKW